MVDPLSAGRMMRLGLDFRDFRALDSAWERLGLVSRDLRNLGSDKLARRKLEKICKG